MPALTREAEGGTLARLMLPPDVLPLFPLPDHVLLPGVPVPFRVFEPRYRQLVADLEALPKDARWLVVPRLADGWKTDYHGRPRFLPVAVAAHLMRVEPLDEGESLIVVEGVLRIHLEEIPSTRPYRLANWTPLPDESAPSEATLLAAEQVLAKVRVLARRVGDGAEQLTELAAGDDRVLAADRLAALLLGDPDARQRHLENRHPGERLAEFARYLNRQLGPGAGGAWDFSRN
jgi:uncharacterized protein